jgi:hypothetical protein
VALVAPGWASRNAGYGTVREKAPQGVSGKPHQKAAAESRQLKVLSDRSYCERKTVALRSCATQSAPNDGRVGVGALTRWPPSAAQTAQTDLPYAAFTKTRNERCKEKATAKWAFLTSVRIEGSLNILGR